MSFRCHSDVILWPKTWRDFCDGMTPKWKYLSLQGRFILERDGMTHGPHLTERQERAWNDPQYLTKEGQTVSKEGQTTPDIRSFPFSFLSFGPRSSFEGRLESFGKERSIWNDLRTRSERGKGRGRSGLISPIERYHSCLILLSFCERHHLCLILLSFCLIILSFYWLFWCSTWASTPANVCYKSWYSFFSDHIYLPADRGVAVENNTL